MRKLLLVAALIAVPGHAIAFDFNDFDTVCTETAKANPPSDPAEFRRICTCAYDVISSELGQDLTVIYARFELGDGALKTMLPADISVEAFFERLGEIGPSIDASCAP